MVLVGEQTTTDAAGGPGGGLAKRRPPDAARPGRKGCESLRVRMLGGFSVQRGGRRAGEEEWGRPAASRLVRFLLVRGGAVSQEEVIDGLWRNLSPAGARRSLQVAASLARKVLDPPDAERSSLSFEADAYRLELGPGDTVDAFEFDALASAALRRAGRGDERVDGLEAARRMWGGEPLPGDAGAVWAEAWRGLLSDRYEAVLSELLELRLARGEAGEATALARQLLTRSPFNERAHRALMVAYSRLGRRDRVLEQYRRCHATLTGELGIEPSRETLEVQRRALAGEPV